MTTKSIGITFLAIILLSGCKTKAYEYTKVAGFAQGTTYHITYENKKGKDYKADIDKMLNDFNKSLSVWDSASIISRINRNEPTVETDDWFEASYKKSVEINRLSDGAFDITVGPVVRAWGFSNLPYAKHDSTYIDSLKQFVGMDKIQLKKHHLIKSMPGVQLDMNGLAQGYSVDVVCRFFDHKGIKNYMVEIGGEVRAKGKNGSGKLWKIGVDKPVDDNMDPGKMLEAVIELDNKSVSTSGNYRKFYIENGVKYSHTIDPKTGRPAHNTLLSATVVAPDCITADALATAFMVMGVEKGKEFLKKLPDVDVLFIYSDSQGNMKVYTSEGMNKMVVEIAK
ncbi:FAD:protein FMN transferase (plasmid) [Trichlorobacter lovleyi]|uniref:FAD:protein FMN transferase n=1 Tax=Trichlorobacter lovleyi TaxID=313985 RepID=UPI00223EDE06|nr:FAD:protein FMN transferase [Trichlorobacter lovleyi]QOX81004.1 FAD:protein FMN transferase [Trichlorobacter lovleyi]